MKGKILTIFFVLLFCCPLVLPAQTRQVTGTVKNTNGEPIPNATVNQKGTSNATQANKEGNFTITLTGAEAVLVVSAINYQSVESPIGSRLAVDIVLSQLASNNMDEVFVVAYGTSKKAPILVRRL